MKWLLLLLTTSAWGTDYKGSGFHQTKTARNDCPNMTFSYEVSATNLNIKGGTYKCRNMTGTYIPRRAEIRGTALFENGQNVGSISSEKILLRSPLDPDQELMIRKYNGDTFVIRSIINQSRMDILVGQFR